MRISRVETFQVAPRWLFLKIHTDEGIVGWGEPTLENRAHTVAQAIAEVEPYLLGKDPTRVMHHWQSIYKHAFYRGGPVLSSALSGIEHALWDITGKALGVPVYKLFGGPLRDRIKVYTSIRGDTLDEQIAYVQARKVEGFRAFKTGPRTATGQSARRFIETPAFVDAVVERFAALREGAGRDVDIAIDFHGAVSPQMAGTLIAALEPFQPMFIEEPVQCQNVDALAALARKTHLPIATGERIFTKWGFREILEKGAASIVQPDISHVGGIFEGRLIAGMAESYYAVVAPHCPLGPISLAAGIQLDASIPNFLCQEQVHLGEGYLKQPFVVRDGYIDLPTGPGLGIEVDEEALQDKIGVFRRHPGLFHPDDGAAIDH